LKAAELGRTQPRSEPKAPRGNHSPVKIPFPKSLPCAKIPQSVPAPSHDSAMKSRAAPQETLRDNCLRAFRHMLEARLLEERLAALYRSGGKIVGGVYLGRGQEAFSSALGIHLKKGNDIFAGLIRDQAGRLAFGEPMLDATRTYLGSVKGPMRGRDGNVHRGRPKEGLPAMISHLGSMVSYVTGMLLGRRLQGRLGTSVGAASIGDGGTSTGAFHEGLNLAAVERLPLVIALANNQYAYSTPNDRQFACAKLVDRAIGYGIDGHEVDATNLEDCVTVFEKAVQRAREGHGPQLVVGSMLRMAGHGEHDDASYIPVEVRQQGRDCLLLAEQTFRKKGWLDDASFKALQTDALKDIEDAVSTASREAKPDPYKESWRSLASASLVDEDPNR